jgi:hypothetical protein
MTQCLRPWRDIQQLADEGGEPIELGIHASQVMQPLRIALPAQTPL